MPVACSNSENCGPQGLKPEVISCVCGTTKVVPSHFCADRHESCPPQNRPLHGVFSQPWCPTSAEFTADVGREVKSSHERPKSNTERHSLHFSYISVLIWKY